MSLRDLLRECGVRYVEAGDHHHVGHSWLGVDCPRCSPNSGRYRLGFPLDTRGAGNCWTCGPARLWDTLIECSPMPANAIKSLLRGYLGSVGVEPVSGGDRAGKGQNYAKFTPPAGVGPLLKPHKRYLRSRGFDPDTIVQLWGVGGIGIAERLSWRLYIPVRRGLEPVSWTTRSIGQTATPYLSARPHEERVHLREVLYGAELARHGIVVCEGPLDAWAVGPGGVATCGVGFSQAQVLAMSEYPVRVVCFDGEPDAQRRGAELCRMLQVFPGDTVAVTLTTGKDASRASERELKRLRRFLV